MKYIDNHFGSSCKAATITGRKEFAGLRNFAGGMRNFGGGLRAVGGGLRNIAGGLRNITGSLRCLAGCLLLLSGCLFLSPACQKANHYAQLVNDQPYVLMGPFGLVDYRMDNYTGYQTSYLVGDTAVLMGRFFLGQPGSRIQIGNDTAHILYQRQVVRRGAADSINQYTGKSDVIDYIRFAITASMGLGNQIPVTIFANGTSVQAPSLTITQFKGIRRMTDPSLYVDSITTWTPPDLNYLMSLHLPSINGSNVAGDGTICFNNLTGIYLLRNQQVSQLAAMGSHYQEGGTDWTIKVILGSVLSYKGDHITFSAAVTENNPDSLTAYIFRLCKMDLASGVVTTLNRTKMFYGVAATNEAGGPYEGSLGALNIVASDLKTDVNDQVYFINNYTPGRTDFDPTTLFYYELSNGQPTIDEPGYSNVCRVDIAGNVKSIISSNSIFGAYYHPPGFVSQWMTDYLVSQDGSTGYVVDYFQGGPFSFSYVDLKSDIPIASSGYNASYRFFSYDTSSITGLHDPKVTFSFGLNGENFMNNYQILPDGDLLTNMGGAMNIQNKSMYSYIGPELVSIGRSPASGTYGTTGPAKNVWLSSGDLFAGLDKSNAIYYYWVDGSSGSVSYYKMYSKH